MDNGSDVSLSPTLVEESRCCKMRSFRYLFLSINLITMAMFSPSNWERQVRLDTLQALGTLHIHVLSSPCNRFARIYGNKRNSNMICIAFSSGILIIANSITRVPLYLMVHSHVSICIYFMGVKPNCLRG